MPKPALLVKLKKDPDSNFDLFDPSRQDASLPYTTDWSASGSIGMAGSAATFSGSAGFATLPFRSYASQSGAPSGGDVYITTGGSGFSFHDVFEAGVSSDFIRCIEAAEYEMEAIFTSTLHLNIDFKAANSGNSGTALGNSWANWTTVSYASLKAALPSSDVLPTADPSGGTGNDWSLPEAYARMLGLNTSTPTYDDTVTLNTYYNWSYGQDVINGLIHEISEGGMGRVGGLGDQNSVWSTMDLFRYSGPKGAGTLDTKDGRDGKTTYFSSNGGATLSTDTFNNEYNSNGTFNNSNDTADWTQQSVFGTTGAGETLTLTQDELNTMAALGWKIKLPGAELFGSSDDWQTPSSWLNGYMPITVQDVYVNMYSGSIGTSKNNVTVYSLGSSVGSTFDISGNSTLTATHGTILNTASTSNFGIGNAGTIRVYTGATLEIGYGFTNTGVLTIGQSTTGTGSATLKIDTANTRFDGTSGAINLGVQSGSSFSSGSITGAGLINATNIISGGGSIKLTTLDNQLGGTIEATHTAIGSNTLTIQADTFTNEGRLYSFAESSLGLGSSTAAESMTNTGTIEAGATGPGNIAITGNYTILGSGSLVLKGAGSSLTSDGKAPATLTNASTIKSVASTQIGDSGILSVNDLTLVNTGSVLASSGGVLTLNTGGKVINNGGGKLIAGGDATLSILSDVTMGTAGAASSGGTIEANANGTVTIASSISNGLASPSVAGQIVIDAGGTVDFLAGSSDSVPINFGGSGGTLELGSVTTSLGTINGFTTGDTVEFSSVAYSADDFVSFVGDGSGAAGTATVEDLYGNTIASVTLQGDYNVSQFSVASVGGNLAVVGVAGLAHQGSADFNEDGFSDILWRSTSGDTESWFTNASGGFGYADDGTVSTDWQIAETGDFNGDGKADILWRNTTSGDAYLYQSNGSNGFNYLDLGVVSTDWQIAGVGDFNNDGLSDILWRNANGDDELWQTTAGDGFNYQGLDGVGTNWTIAGVGDFNGDGASDILWRDTSGDTETWFTQTTGGFTYAFDGTISTDWKVAGLGDFTGDGKSDILWRNTTSGDVFLYGSNGPGAFNYADLGAVGTDWQIAKVGDFNGDGLSDILWRNTNGANEIWETKAGGGFDFVDAGAVSTNWKIVG